LIKARFVGGVADGRIQVLRDAPYWIKFAVPPKITPRWWDNSPLEPIEIETVTYEQFSLRGDSEMFYLYAPVGWTADMIFNKLLFDGGIASD
jgi:hypothetical protein